MPIMNPFEGAKSEREQANRDLLNVIAQSGAAGKAAYDAARKEAATMRQGALDTAAQRAQLTGQDLGPAATAATTEAADRFNTYFGGQEAAHQAQLGQIGASGQSYLSKVGQIAPFMQQQALTQAAEREKKYQSEIAANQAKIDAEKAAAERAHQQQIELLGIKNKYDVAADARANAAAAAKEAAKPGGGLTKARLLGAGQTLADDYSQFLNTPDAFTADESARALAAYKGIPSVDVNEILGPRGEGAPPPAPVPQPMFDKNWLMQNVTMPGTNKKVTASRADDVLRAPELATAQEFLQDLGVAKKTRGAIDDPVLFGNEYRGLSPRDAFNKWIDSQPGIRTMKEALKQYYAPYLDSLGR